MGEGAELLLLLALPLSQPTPPPGTRNPADSIPPAVPPPEEPADKGPSEVEVSCEVPPAAAAAATAAAEPPPLLLQQ